MSLVSSSLGGGLVQESISRLQPPVRGGPFGFFQAQSIECFFAQSLGWGDVQRIEIFYRCSWHNVLCSLDAAHGFLSTKVTFYFIQEEMIKYHRFGICHMARGTISIYYFNTTRMYRPEMIQIERDKRQSLSQLVVINILREYVTL